MRPKKHSMRLEKAFEKAFMHVFHLVKIFYLTQKTSVTSLIRSAGGFLVKVYSII